MKKIILITTGVCMTLFSCKKAETVTVEKDTVTPVESAPITECYGYFKGKDTITATFSVTGDQVTGNLDYKFFEKDKNSGTFSGSMKGDTIMGDYTFQSEGMTSVREVVFLKANNTLTEGSGEIAEKDGKMVFKNPKALRFNDGLVLQKSNCD